ncbi:hypothetical protein Emag_006844 [Eimeria magna]
MIAEEMSVEPGDAQGLFDDDDEDDTYQQQQQQQQQQRQQQRQQQQQQQQMGSDSAASLGPFSSFAFSANPAAAAATAEEESLTCSASAAASEQKQQQQQQQEEEQQQQQQEQEETVDMNAVLLQCSGCPCHVLVFEELQSRGLSLPFELLHMTVLAAAKPPPLWQQQQQQQHVLQHQQQQQDMLQPVDYTWGLAETQQLVLNLSLLRFVLDCMQGLGFKFQGLGASKRPALHAAAGLLCLPLVLLTQG